MTVLACLAIAMARARGAIGHEDEARLSAALTEVPSRAVEVLNHGERLKALAGEIADVQDVPTWGAGQATRSRWKAR